MGDEAVEGLTISYRGSEWTPDKATEYLAFSAEMSYQGFSGVTEIETTGESMAALVTDLAKFYDDLAGTVQFTAGWGETEYFSLQLSSHGSRGDVLISCIVQQPSVGDTYNKASIVYVAENNQINELLRFFQSVSSFRQPQSTYLVPKM